jgi:predicted glycosyltransferase involved in capsule biosynthesis
MNQIFTDFEIIVAEDGSSLEISQLLESFRNKFRHPIIHARHEDKGFRKTIIVNEAVRQSKSDYLIFIDGDCILHHRFIERHYKRKKAGTVLSGRRIMFSKSLSQLATTKLIAEMKVEKPSFWWKQSSFKARKRGFYLPFIFHLLNFFGKDYWAFGSNFSLSKADFIAVNGYDESILGRGMEDVNLTERFKLKNYKIRRLTYEAIQYHLFHNSDPVSFTNEEMDIIMNPKSFYASKGIY